MSRKETEWRFAARGVAGLLIAGLVACAHLATGDLPRFAGPGQLLLLLERDGRREIALLGDAETRVLDASQLGGTATDARFIDRDTLLVLVEAPGQDEFGLPDVQLRRIDLRDGRQLAIGGPGRRYDPEPSADGRWLAVGADVAGVGDSNLEIWALEGEPERVAVRHQSLEEPRWRPDGFALVASVLMPDPETDEDLGGGFAGTSFTWPRLHRLRRDLGEPSFVWDGETPETVAAGGTLALWWDARGLWARQPRGLVRCELAARRCRLVFAPSGERRVVDGRAVGPDQAWLLTVDASDAFDRRRPDGAVRVSLDSGRVLARWQARQGTEILDIDWIGTDRARRSAARPAAISDKLERPDR
jgi:hypothetical protein